MTKLKLSCAVLIFLGVLFGASYFLAGVLEQHEAAVEGGFTSVEEMMLAHRLGLGSGAEYLAYREAHQARQRKDRTIQNAIDEKERLKQLSQLEEKKSMEYRIKSLPKIILATHLSENHEQRAARDQFKLACEIANGVKRTAIVQGAESNFFVLPKINEMVRSDPSSFAAVEISNPVRWDDSSQICKAWFTVDGVYNGVRYQGYYYGIVHSFQRDDQGAIFATSFDPQSKFVNNLE